MKQWLRMSASPSSADALSLHFQTQSHSTTTFRQIAGDKRSTATATAFMVLFKNIRATVIRYDDKKPYHEYKLTQNATKRSQTVKEAYVEVVSGERFAVVVELLSTFDFQSAPDVRIRRQVDGMKQSNIFLSKKQATSTHMGNQIGTLQRRTWGQYPRKIDGRWMNCALVFTDLQLGMRS